MGARQISPDNRGHVPICALASIDFLRGQKVLPLTHSPHIESYLSLPARAVLWARVVAIRPSENVARSGPSGPLEHPRGPQPPHTAARPLTYVPANTRHPHRHPACGRRAQAPL